MKKLFPAVIVALTLSGCGRDAPRWWRRKKPDTSASNMRISRAQIFVFGGNSDHQRSGYRRRPMHHLVRRWHSAMPDLSPQTSASRL